MTQFMPVEGIASLESEPHCDYTYLALPSDSVDKLYLAYALKRDFLSVPLSYNVLCFSSSSSLEIHKMGMDEYLDGFEEDVEIPQPGFYQFEANDDGAEPVSGEMDIFLLADRSSVLEIMYESMVKLTTIYHCPDAKTALLNALSEQD